MAWTGSAVGVRLPRSEGAQVPILSDKGRSPHRSGPGRLWRGSRLPSRCELLPQTATKGRRVTLFGSARARRLARSASRRRALAADISCGLAASRARGGGRPYQVVGPFHVWSVAFTRSSGGGLRSREVPSAFCPRSSRARVWEVAGGFEGRAPVNMV